MGGRRVRRIHGDGHPGCAGPGRDPGIAVHRGDLGRGAVDGGSVTVEAAMALAVLAVVLVACLAGVACVIAQVRCADAAREAARLAGRGDPGAASAAVATLAPNGASLSLGGSGDLVLATVSVAPIGGILPGVTIRASASAAREPAS
jgi:hypothetical protein